MDVHSPPSPTPRLSPTRTALARSPPNPPPRPRIVFPPAACPGPPGHPQCPAVGAFGRTHPPHSGGLPPRPAVRPAGPLFRPPHHPLCPHTIGAPPLPAQPGPPHGLAPLSLSGPLIQSRTPSSLANLATRSSAPACPQVPLRRAGTGCPLLTPPPLSPPYPSASCPWRRPSVPHAVPERPPPPHLPTPGFAVSRLPDARPPGAPPAFPPSAVPRAPPPTFSPCHPGRAPLPPTGHHPRALCRSTLPLLPGAVHAPDTPGPPALTLAPPGPWALAPSTRFGLCLCAGRLPRRPRTRACGAPAPGPVWRPRRAAVPAAAPAARSPRAQSDSLRSAVPTLPRFAAELFALPPPPHLRISPPFPPPRPPRLPAPPRSPFASTPQSSRSPALRCPGPPRPRLPNRLTGASPTCSTARSPTCLRPTTGHPPPFPHAPFLGAGPARRPPLAGLGTCLIPPFCPGPAGPAGVPFASLSNTQCRLHPTPSTSLAHPIAARSPPRRPSRRRPARPRWTPPTRPVAGAGPPLPPPALSLPPPPRRHIRLDRSAPRAGAPPGAARSPPRLASAPARPRPAGALLSSTSHRGLRGPGPPHVARPSPRGAPGRTLSISPPRPSLLRPRPAHPAPSRPLAGSAGTPVPAVGLHLAPAAGAWPADPPAHPTGPPAPPG